MSSMNVVAVVALFLVGIASIVAAARNGRRFSVRSLRLALGASCLVLALLGCISVPHRIVGTLAICVAVAAQLALAYRAFRASRVQRSMA